MFILTAMLPDSGCLLSFVVLAIDCVLGVDVAAVIRLLNSLNLFDELSNLGDIGNGNNGVIGSFGSGVGGGGVDNKAGLAAIKGGLVDVLILSVGGGAPGVDILELVGLDAELEVDFGC